MSPVRAAALMHLRERQTRVRPDSRQSTGKARPDSRTTAVSSREQTMRPLLGASGRGAVAGAVLPQAAHGEPDDVGVASAPPPAGDRRTPPQRRCAPPDRRPTPPARPSSMAHWLQHTSRDGDMQLHVHPQIAHVAKTTTDGKWRAPDSLVRYPDRSRAARRPGARLIPICYQHVTSGADAAVADSVRSSGNPGAAECRPGGKEGML